VPHPQQQQQQQQHSSSTMPNTINGNMEQGGYPFHHYPYFQYLNDYDSY
jgi:hypothetical protein